MKRRRAGSLDKEGREGREEGEGRCWKRRRIYLARKGDWSSGRKRTEVRDEGREGRKGGKGSSMHRMKNG